MRRVFLFICIILIHSLSGCSKGISQYDYNILLSENETIQHDYDLLRSEYNKLLIDYNNLKEDHEKLMETKKEAIDALNDITSKYINDTQTYGEDILVEAWGKASFGNDTKFTRIDNNMVQYIVTIREISIESIKNIFNDISNNLTTLADISSYEAIPYFYIKFIDINKNPVLECFIDLENKDKLNTNIMTNATYNNLIADAIENLD